MLTPKQAGFLSRALRRSGAAADRVVMRHPKATRRIGGALVVGAFAGGYTNGVSDQRKLNRFSTRTLQGYGQQ